MVEGKQDSEQGIRSLVHWASSVHLEDIPEHVLKRAVLVIADDLGAMVASRNEPEVVRIHGQLLGKTAEMEATVFRGDRPQTDRFSAAVANAVAACWSELDEGYRKVTCHAGLYTVPALLAEAEAEGLSVGEVLRSVVLSYEVVTRLARTWIFPSLTLHPHAIFAAAGAASAIASLRRLDLTEFLNAVTASATLTTVGPFDHGVKGALVRNVWVAAGAWNGMRSVDWAQCGIAGLDSTLYDVYTTALGAEVHPEYLSSELGTEWAICDGYHKIFACCQYAHSAVEATLAVLADMQTGRGREDIKKIVVETHARGLTLNNYHPETTLAAKFSMPHIVAVTFLFGHAGVEAFGSSTLASPEAARLRGMVELRRFLPEQAWPHDRPARVTVEFEDGQRLTRECMSAKGGPDRPLSTEEILNKVSYLTEEVYPNLAPTMAEILTLPAASKVERWGDLVTQLTRLR